MKIHPEALESLNRYRADLKAGHTKAAEYWRGQAAAYFTANPKKNFFLGEVVHVIGEYETGTAILEEFVIRDLFTNTVIVQNVYTRKKMKVPVSYLLKVKYRNPSSICPFCKIPLKAKKTIEGKIKYCPKCQFGYFAKNPIFATIGSAALTGLGIGIGYGVANKVMRNPDQLWSSTVSSFKDSMERLYFQDQKAFYRLKSLVVRAIRERQDGSSKTLHQITYSQLKEILNSMNRLYG